MSEVSHADPSSRRPSRVTRPPLRGPWPQSPVVLHTGEGPPATLAREPRMEGPGFVMARAWEHPQSLEATTWAPPQTIREVSRGRRAAGQSHTQPSNVHPWGCDTCPLSWSEASHSPSLSPGESTAQGVDTGAHGAPGACWPPLFPSVPTPTQWNLRSSGRQAGPLACCVASGRWLPSLSLPLHFCRTTRPCGRHTRAHGDLLCQAWKSSGGCRGLSVSPKPT